MKTDEETGGGGAVAIVEQQTTINKRTLASILSKNSPRPTTAPSVIITDETSTSRQLEQQQQELTPISNLLLSSTPSAGAAAANGILPAPAMMDSIVMATDDPAAQTTASVPAVAVVDNELPSLSRLTVLRQRCCSHTVRTTLWGLLVMSSVSAAWLGSAHLLKSTFQLTTVDYNNSQQQFQQTNNNKSNNNVNVTMPNVPPLWADRGSLDDNLYRLTVHGGHEDDNKDNNFNQQPDDDDILTVKDGENGEKKTFRYGATFLSTWTISTWPLLYLPLYVLGSLITGRPGPRRQLVSELRDSLLAFKEKGFTRGTFLSRCCLFCLLWVGTNWMYMYALSVLDATDVMALFATNVSFVYLLSWVVLHIQFVGLRIVAVIFCNTGIALLAYMDGIAGRSPTLGGVVLAAAASAGSAVYKVSFKKMFGDATYGQVSFFFSFIGLLNLVLLWPILLTLHFSGAETVDWLRVPWAQLAAAGALSLLVNLLSNFGSGITYEVFIHLGIVAAIPISAVLDMEFNGAVYEGMKLAGTVMIVSGFLLVLLPANWTDYFARFLTWGRNLNQNNQPMAPAAAVDLRTGYISRSHLRTPSGRVK